MKIKGGTGERALRIQKGMTEHDVIRAMGRFPDEINYPDNKPFLFSSPTFSGKWECVRCGKVYEVTCDLPAPCEVCGGIGWIKVQSDG